jgi:hypothetical protein
MIKKIKFTILVRRDGFLVKKTVTCCERHTQDTSQDAFEVFYNKYRFTQDLPEGMDDATIANVLSRGMLPGVGRCDTLLVDWEYV